MSIRNLLASAAALATVALASQASAAVVLPLNMLFQSGATFSGTVTMTDDHTLVTGVNGTLHGYAYGGGYDGVSNDLISWIWNGGSNFASAPDYSTFLMDGPANSGYGIGGYTHWIAFAYDTNTLAFSNAGYGNVIDYSDPMVSGALGGVPEPATWALMISGFGLAGASLRRRKAVFA